MNPTINDKLASNNDKKEQDAPLPRAYTNLQSTIEAFERNAEFFRKQGDKIAEEYYLRAVGTYRSMLPNLLKP